MNEKSDCYRLFPIKKKKKNVFKFKNAQKKMRRAVIRRHEQES